MTIIDEMNDYGGVEHLGLYSSPLINDDTNSVQNASCRLARPLLLHTMPSCTYVMLSNPL